MTLAVRERRVSDGRAERDARPLRPGSSRPAPTISRGRIWVPVLAVWAASRVFFFLFGVLGHEAVRQSQVRGLHPEPLGALSYWAHWDGRWFAHIATNGYDTDAATAFFPLYPLVLRVGAEAGVGVALFGVAISTLATLAALYFVFAIGRAWYGERAAFAAIVTLAFFPTAFYLNAVYSDPLFLALTAGAVWALYVRRSLLLAGAFAALAALTRNIGGLLVLPLAYEWLRNRREFGWSGLVGVAGPVAGVLAYALFLWGRSGDPLLFSAAYEQNWHRSLGNPLITLRDGFAHAHDGVSYLVPGRVFETASTLPATLLSNTLNFCFLGFACLTLILAVRRVPPGVLLYAIPAALGPLAMSDERGLPLISYPRYVLVVFPLFLAVSAVLARSRLALVAWTVASATVGAYLTVLFASWRWVA
jgi:Mannosyltransferase (PIG-V)